MKRKQAFTLVELLISLIITGLVMASVITLFFSVFKSYELHQDITEAKQRGHIALAAIQPFILNAGLGLPSNDLSTAFKDEAAQPIDVLNGFTSAVQLAASQDVASVSQNAPALWLVYSVPSNAGVDFEYQFPANSNVVIAIPAFAKLQAADYLSTNKKLLKAWVSFPSASEAFAIYGIDSTNRTLTLRSASSQTIAAFDELHHVRAAKIFVDPTTSSLIIEKLDGSNPQPVVDGVTGMWCTFDQDGDRILTVYILARASAKRTAGVQGEIEGWPSAAEAHWARDSAYRHAVVSRSWRIRN